VRSVDLFFVDRNDVFLISATTRSVGSAPRDETLSTEALEYWGGLVVRDLAADPAHASRPEVTGPPYLRFYAGYPVESPEGRRVAVLTIVDTEPRDISPSELSLLRHFALRVGSLLFEQYRP
jgi:GAF domain-containing protein